MLVVTTHSTQCHTIVTYDNADVCPQTPVPLSLITTSSDHERQHHCNKHRYINFESRFENVDWLLERP